MEEKLIAKFGPSLKGKDTIITEFQQLMSLYALNIHELYIKWEQFAFQNKTSKFDEITVSKFRSFLQQQIEKRNGTSSANTSINNDSLKGTPMNFNKTNILSSLKRPLQQNLKRPSASPSGNSIFGNSSQVAQDQKKKRTLMGTSSPLLTNNVSHQPSKDFDLSADDIEDSFLFQKEFQKDYEDTSMAPQMDDSFDESKDFKTPFVKESESKIIKSAFKSSKRKSGAISKTLNSHIEVCSSASENDKLRIVPYFDAEKYKFRTMRQNIVDVADYLDDQIETFIDIFTSTYDNVEMGDPTLQSQSEITCCGRIVPDNSNISTENNLNADSIALETSRMIGIGKRVKLELGDLKDQSFFQGQIVGLKGKNPTGEYFHVNEVLELPYLGAPLTSRDEFTEIKENMNNGDTKVIVAAGPFTSSSSLDFSEFIAFIEKVNTEYKPHSLILLGPFLDISNDLILKGDIPEFPGITSQPKTLDELFAKVFAPLLKTVHSDIQIVLIPNANDTVMNHCAYPQPPLEKRHLQTTGPSKNIKCFPNPATFQINEMFVGISNIDFFKNCKDVFVGGDMLLTNRFERLSRYVLQQRRYFPMTPPSWNQSFKVLSEKQKVQNFGVENAKHVQVPTNSNDAPSIDLAYSGLTEFVAGIIPDVIILPSDLNPFAHIVDNVIVLNPGTFISRITNQPGSFLQVTVKAVELETLSKVDDNGDEEMFLHDIWKRARVDIVNV